MRVRKRKPDFILLLAIIVGLGVIITMMTQAGAESRVVVNKTHNKSLYNDAWSKINNKMNRQLSNKLGSN